MGALLIVMVFITWVMVVIMLGYQGSYVRDSFMPAEYKNRQGYFGDSIIIF